MYFDDVKGDWYCATCRTFLGHDPECCECEDRFDSLLESSASAE